MTRRVGSQHKSNHQMVADSDCWNVAFMNKSNDCKTPVNQSCQWGNQAMLKKKKTCLHLKIKIFYNICQDRGVNIWLATQYKPWNIIGSENFITWNKPKHFTYIFLVKLIMFIIFFLFLKHWGAKQTCQDVASWHFWCLYRSKAERLLGGSGHNLLFALPSSDEKGCCLIRSDVMKMRWEGPPLSLLLWPEEVGASRSLSWTAWLSSSFWTSMLTNEL